MTAPIAMPAMAAVPRLPFNGAKCEVPLVVGWLVVVLDDDVLAPDDIVFVATAVEAAAWPSWVTYIRTAVLAIYRLVDHNRQGNGRLTELAKIEDGYATPASLQLPMFVSSLNIPT
jgi:hypothetical protein